MKKRGIKRDKFVIEKEKDYIRKNQYQKKKMMMLVRNDKKIIRENGKILHKRLKDDIIVDNYRNNAIKC